VSLDGGGEASLSSSSSSSKVEENKRTTVTKLNDDNDIVKISSDSVPMAEAEQEGRETKVTPTTSLDTQ
jgi:hypothetical protein